MEDPKYYQHTCELMESILKRDDFKAWLEEAEHIPEDFISDFDKQVISRTCSVTTAKSFDDIYTTYCYLMARLFREFC